MSYDALTESVRLLGGAALPGDARVSRRVRFLPLAVDRDDDVAATLFLRRGVSASVLEVHTLELGGSDWQLLGGSGGGGWGNGEAPTRPRLAELGGLAQVWGRGGSARKAGGRLTPGRAHWVGWAKLRLARDVAALRADSRVLPVPDHGFAIVVWRRQPPHVTGLDAFGNPLGGVPVSLLAMGGVR